MPWIFIQYLHLNDSFIQIFKVNGLTRQESFSLNHLWRCVLSNQKISRKLLNFLHCVSSTFKINICPKLVFWIFFNHRLFLNINRYKGNFTLTQQRQSSYQWYQLLFLLVKCNIKNLSKLKFNNSEIQVNFCLADEAAFQCKPMPGNGYHIIKIRISFGVYLKGGNTK